MNNKILKLFGSKPIIWVPMWGISKLRKRGGAFAGEIPGQSLWFDQWYDRAMSRKNVEKLSKLGVNLVILPFSLGGSADAEREERDDFERMTRFLHEFDILSLPYMQYQNLLQEENVPDGTVWAETLEKRREQYCYWRRTACQSSNEFINYFKTTISDALRLEADGIWIDNNYLRPCRCELCVKAFRLFLEEERSDLLESLYLKDFSQIELPPSLDSVYHNDPIVQAFMQFNCDRNVKIHNELKTHMESIKSDAVFGSNPALYRGNSYAARGVDFYKMFKVNDIIYLENKFFPEEKDGQVSGNYHGFVMGDALGTPAIPGAWKKADFDSTSGAPRTGLPKTPSEIERALLEGPVFGGASGAFWAVRNVPKSCCSLAKEQLNMYYEIPEIHESMRETFAYIQSLPVFGDRHNLAEVAVLYHQDSMSLDFDVHHAASHGVEELLMTSGIPFTVLHSFELEDKASRFRLLVLPGTRLLSEADGRILEQYVDAGGRVLILGRDCGLYDEYRRPRLDSILKEMAGVSCFGEIESPCFNVYGEGMTALIAGKDKSGIEYINMMSADAGAKTAPNWLGNPTNIIDAIDKLLDGKRQVELNTDSNVAVTVAEIDDERVAVQLFSYADAPMPETLELKINVDHGGSAGTLYQFGHPPMEILFEKGKAIMIPDFKRHAALILT
jgi:hypothetical protein